VKRKIFYLRVDLILCDLSPVGSQYVPGKTQRDRFCAFIVGARRQLSICGSHEL
jgi:hypothetical protein